MKLKAVYTESLFNLGGETIEFLEPEVDYFGRLKISIIVGENGTGKTSLLKFIAESFLYPENRGYTKKAFERGFELNYAIGKDEVCLNPKTIRQLSNYPSNIIVSTTALNGKFASMDKKTSNTHYIYNGPLKSELLTIFKCLLNPEVESSVLELLNMVGYLKRYRLVLPEEQILESMIYKGLKKKYKQITNQMGADTQDFLQIYRNIAFARHETNNRKRVVHGEDLYFSGFGYIDKWISFIESMMEERINLDLQIEVQNPNSKWVNIKEMSSGEQAIFNRFFSLLSLVKNNSLVLIDEPETHLHPKWLKQYIYMLNKLFSKFNAHIVIATHSPLIASDVPNECIVGLIKDWQTGHVKQFDIYSNTLGGNPLNILNEVFGVSSHTGAFTYSVITQIENYIRDGNKDKGLELLRDLGTSLEKYSLFNKLNEI